MGVHIVSFPPFLKIFSLFLQRGGIRCSLGEESCWPLSRSPSLITRGLLFLRPGQCFFFLPARRGGLRLFLFLLCPQPVFRDAAFLLFFFFFLFRRRIPSIGGFFFFFATLFFSEHLPQDRPFPVTWSWRREALPFPPA